MSKFHINKHGVPAPCRATKGNCPLGGASGSENHFESEQEAQVHINSENEKEHGLLPGMERKSDTLRNLVNEKFSHLNEGQREKITKHADLEKQTVDIALELENTEDKGSPEYWNKSQDLRDLALKQYAAHSEIKDYATQEELDELMKDEVPQKGLYPRLPSYHDKVENTAENIDEGLGPVISAYTGKSMSEVKKDIEAIRDEKSISYHEATVEHWRNMERRTDKPIISIDLETGNAMGKALNYDNGQLTHIIELGAIKTHPDGRVERVNFLADLPKEHADRYGTGFIQAHNISLDDIKGKPKFSDPKVQKQMADFLDNSVLIAQNAEFENKQLTHSLEGFRGKVDSGNIEFLDTHKFAKHLMPETEGNSNKHLVGAAGLKYEGAHRALNDAEMTLNSFNILKDNR